MKRVWLIAAMGDIRGYRKWCRNPSTTQEIYRPFMRKYHRMVTAFCKKWNCRLTRMGDGFVFFLEIPTKARMKFSLAEFLADIALLTKNILNHVKNCSWPRPGGFRIRLPGGWVDREMMEDLHHPGMELKIPEYTGEAPNFARDLIYVNPETPILIHYSVIERLKKEEIKKLGVRPFDVDQENKSTVHHEVGDLWEMPLEKK